MNGKVLVNFLVRFIQIIIFGFLHPLIFLYKKFRGIEYFVFGHFDWYGMVLINPLTKKPDFIYYCLNKNKSEETLIDTIIHEWLHYVIAKEVGLEESKKFDNIADKVTKWVLSEE